MAWQKTLRRLIFEDPKYRHPLYADLLLFSAPLLVTLWVYDVTSSRVTGLVTGALVWVLGEVLFRMWVRKRRPP
jgi:hypothetical protein